MSEQYVVVSSPIWNGDLVAEGYQSAPLQWEDAIDLVRRITDEAVIVEEGANVPLYWAAQCEDEFCVYEM